MAALAALVSGVGIEAGCSFVSGWSDLQGGVRASSGEDGGADASAAAGGGGVDAGSVTADSGSGGGDAGGGVDGGGGAPDSGGGAHSDASVVTTVLCGTVRCSPGDGCCAALLGKSETCQAASATCGPPSAFLACSDSSQCTASLGPAAQCCQPSQGDAVGCRSSCAGLVICDPTFPAPSCPTGTTCQPNTEYDFNTCQ